MNRLMTGVIFGAALMGSGLASGASDQNQHLAECREQLETIYGEDTRVRLRGRGVSRDLVLNFSVYPEGQGQLRVSCKRTRDGTLELSDRQGVALVPPNHGGDELTTL